MSEKRDEWLVKVRRNGGGESVEARYAMRERAYAHMLRLNDEYQSENYYVEQYDPELAVTFLEPKGTR